MSDINYWNYFYSNYDVDTTNSNFSSFCYNYIKDLDLNLKSLIDIGAGNGRDTIFFCEKNFNVTFLEQNIKMCEQINNYKQKNKKENLTINNSSFLEKIPTSEIYYARFVLHTLEVNDLDTFFKNIYNSMNDNSYLFIETRSIKGTQYENKNFIKSYFDNKIGKQHYRLLLNHNFLQKIYLDNGFVAEFFSDDNNYSLIDNENPYLIRLVLRKNIIYIDHLKLMINNDTLNYQKKIKSFFDNFLLFLKKYNLRYFVFFGNLLSLIRYDQLFLKWDDDLDIIMPETDLIFLNKQIDNNFILTKLSDELWSCSFNDLSFDIFTTEFIKIRQGLTDDYFNDYYEINNYRVPINYKIIFDDFYMPTNNIYINKNYITECVLYNHNVNDRWKTSKHEKKHLNIKELDYILQRGHF